MSTSIHDTKLTPDHAAFLAAMEQARETADKSIALMNAVSKSLGDLSVPGIDPVAGGIKNVLRQGRQAAARARRTFPGAGISAPDMSLRRAAHRTLPGHFKMPDADHFARLGLFIGNAPQSPGLSEARRTAIATEALVKKMDRLINSAKGGVAPIAVFA